MSVPHITKLCPECGSEMTIRTNRNTDTQFIGCTRYPECTHTENISETLKMQLAGAPTLFDEPEPTPAIDRRHIVHCKSCGAAIVWGETKNGKPCPYNVVGMRVTDVSHFTTCPQARQWSKQS